MRIHAPNNRIMNAYTHTHMPFKQYPLKDSIHVNNELSCNCSSATCTSTYIAQKMYFLSKMCLLYNLHQLGHLNINMSAQVHVHL